jgi:uncharacterized protein YdhG (YjbR/CyaY superfamily)
LHAFAQFYILVQILTYMQPTVNSPQEYIDTLPDDKRVVISQLRTQILENLPKGFEEVISYGILGYVVPHTVYPKGYHCDTKLPLPFINIAARKNYVALYHMGLYADKELKDWFTTAYAAQNAPKLDMGKSCIRFKKAEQIPFTLIGELASKLTPVKWIELYESRLQK